LLAAADLAADATAPAVTFLVAFLVGVAVCAKATVDPATIERITNVAKTAENSFLLIIFHLQNTVGFSRHMIFDICYKLCFSRLSDVVANFKSIFEKANSKKCDRTIGGVRHLVETS
jgi:hypothetical protein